MALKEAPIQEDFREDQQCGTEGVVRYPSNSQEDASAFADAFARFDQGKYNIFSVLNYTDPGKRW